MEGFPYFPQSHPYFLHTDIFSQVDHVAEKYDIYDHLFGDSLATLPIEYNVNILRDTFQDRNIQTRREEDDSEERLK